MNKTPQPTSTLLPLLTSWIWLNLGKFVGLAGGVIISAAFAHLIEPNIYGQYVAYMASLGLISAFSLTGLGPAINQALAKNKTAPITSSFNWVYLITLINTALIVGLNQGIRGFDWHYLLALGLLQPLYYASNLYRHVLYGRKQFLRAGVIHSVIEFVSQAILLLAIWLQASIPGLIITSLAPTALLQLAVWLHLDTIKLWPSSAWTLTPTIWYGVKLSLIDLIPSLIVHLDKVILALIVPPSQLALYSFAIMLPNLARGYLKTFNTVLLPELTHRDLWHSPKIIRRFTFLFISLVGLVFVYWLVCPLIFNILYRPYVQAIPLSQWASLVWLGYPAQVIAINFQAKRQTQALVTSNVIYLIIFVTSFSLGGFYYGLTGAILGLVLARIAMFPINLGLAAKSRSS